MADKVFETFINEPAGSGGGTGIIDVIICKSDASILFCKSNAEFVTPRP